VTPLDASDHLELAAAGPEDAGALAHLWLDAFPTEFGTVLGDRAPQFLAQWLPLDPSVYDGTTVARLDGEEVGYIQFKTKQETPPVTALYRSCRQAIPLLRVAVDVLGVARAPGCVARFAWMDAESLPPESLYIRMIGIDARYRGRRIGSRLLEYADGEARRRGLKKVSLGVVVENPGAKRLYERHGYQAGELKSPRLLEWASGARGFYPMVKELK
jgi:ribosomal protein S18 acetylase RimI-like enzyme